MPIGLVLVALALICSCAGAQWAAADNVGYRLPHIYGKFTVPKTRRVRTAEAAGWILSLIGGNILANELWPAHPLASIAVFVVVLVGINGTPALIATVLHNHRLASR